MQSFPLVRSLLLAEEAYGFPTIKIVSENFKQ